MEIEKRIQIVRLVEKLEKNQEYSKRLGIKNKSKFRMEKEET